MITTKQAAEELGIGHSTVRWLIAQGHLAATKITERLYLIEEKELAKLARKKRPGPGRPKKST